jgi:PAS domain S-box-containing protein
MEQNTERESNDFLKNELSFYKTALDSATVIAITDISGNITYVNDKFCEQYGYSREEVIGQNHRIINSGYHPKEYFKELWDTISAGKIWRGEVRNKNKKGDIIWVDATIIPFLDANKKPYQYLAIRYDISEKLSAVRFRELFLASMSHEIRTPLHGIMNFLSLMEKTPLDSNQKEYVGLMQNSSETLLRIINDLLDFYKFESGNLSFESVDFSINEVINSVIHFYSYNAAERKVQLDFIPGTSIPETIKGDAHRLKQVILNLISNALKYTHNGQISIATTLVDYSDERCVIGIGVTDTGSGIPEEKIPFIFDKFTQVNVEDSRLYGGSGLGLSIVKQIIELQGGSISVSSKLDQGSTFYFEIPYLIPVLEKPVLNIANPGLPEKKLKVLVVDDVYANRLILSKFLAKFGIASEFAENGKEAVERVQQINYDLILLDMQMPVMDGYTATSEIRNNSGDFNKTIPIIAVTAAIEKTETEKILKSGVTDLLYKPFTTEELYTKILPYLSADLKFKVTTSNGNNNSNESLCNMSYLEEIADGDFNLKKEIIDYFTDNTPALLLGMKQDFEKQALNELYKKLHTFIPQLAFVGLKAAVPHAEKIEKFAKNNEQDNIILESIDVIESLCNKAYSELKIYLSICINSK